MSDIRNLKLQVVLAAVDKMTGPLKAALSGSKALSGQLKATREQLAGLRDSQRSMETLTRLREQAAQSTQALHQSRQAIDKHSRALEMAKTEQTDVAARLKVAQKHYDSLNDSLIKFPQLSGNYTTAIAKARYELEALQKQHTTNKNAIRRTDEALRNESKRLQENTARRSQLAEQLRKTTSNLRDAGIKTYKLGEHQAELASQMGEVNRKLAEQESRLAKVNRLQAKQRAIRAKYEGALQTRDRIAGAGASSMAAGSAVGLPVLSMVKDFSAYEDAMLGIARQVDGARDAGGKLTPVYYQMGDAIREMSQQIPMATTELAALVEGGARMGIKGKDELLAFTRTAALASTAFDLPAGQISEDLGKIANTYKIPIKNIAELGDTINWLDDNAQSKGADIIDVMQRIAGNTGSMSYKEAAALGSTFLSLGASSEVAATATKAMVRELATADRQPKRFQAGLKELGLNAKKVMADMAKDSTGTILRVMEAVNKLPDSKRMGVTVDLFGKEYGDDAAKLAANLGEYRKQLALVNEQKAKGSMQREGDAKNDTLSAKYQMAQNTLFNAKAALGENLRAPAIEAMTAISDVLKRVSAWTAANPQLAATLMKAAAAAAIITTVLGGLLLAVAGIIGPFLAARFAMSMLGIRLGSLLPSATDARAALQHLPSALSAVTKGANSTATTLRTTLAKAWQEADPRKATARAADYAKSLKDRIPAASKAAWEATTQWGKGVGDKLQQNLQGAKLAAKQYSVQLWDTVKASLAANRAAATSKWQTARRYVAAKGIGGMGKDAMKGSINLAKGGFMATVNGMGSALMGLGRTLMFVGRLAMMNPIGLALAAAAFLVIKYWQPIKAWFGGFWQGLTAGLAPLSGALNTIFTAIGPALAPLRPVWDWLVGAFKSAWDWVSKLLSPINATKQSLDAASASGQGFGKWLANLIVIGAELTAKFVTIGAQIMQGLVTGIKSGIQWVKEAISGVGDMLPEWLRKKLDIHSPSRVFASIGGWTMEGLGIGLDKGAGQPLASLQQLAGQLIERAKGIVLPAPAMATPDDDRAITRRRVLAAPPPLLQRITAALPAFQLPALPAVDTGGMGNGLANLRDMLGKISIATSLAGSVAMQPAAAVPIDTRPPVAVQRQVAAPAAAPVYHIQIHAAPGMDEAQLARMVAVELDRRDREAGARRRSRLGDSD